MAKPKLNEFKKYIDSLDESSLRAELLKLFGKLPQVQAFYAQELLSEAERKAMLDEYKKKIHNQFWTRGGNPRSPSNAEIKKLIGEFEKVSVFPHELIDLLLYRVETATAFANEFGGMPDADYNAAYNAFAKALKLMKSENLHTHFKARCEALFLADNLDYWYIEDLQDAYRELFG